MSKEYRILRFEPEQGTMVIQFRGHWPYNYYAPIVNGAYISGETLETWVQSLYPYTHEERVAMAATATGADAVQALVSSEQFEIPGENNNTPS
jgi:hypothetical protein